ncbi:MFS transporter [Saliphagus sp. GCM10025334]
MQPIQRRLSVMSPEFLRTAGVVNGGHFLSHFYLMSLPPLFPLLATDFNATNAQLGILISMIYLSMFLLQIPVGELVDRVGAKYVFVLGVLLSGVGTMMIAFAGSYRHLLVFALVAGMGQSAFHPADYALLNAVTDSNREGKSFGMHTFAGFIGFAAAPPVVGTIGIVHSWQSALLIVGAVGVGYAIFAQGVLNTVYLDHIDTAGREAPSNESNSVRRTLTVLRRPSILTLFAFFVVVTMADIGIQSFTAVFLVEGFDFSEAAGNTILTMFLVLTAIGVLIGGELADRYNVFWIIILSLSISAVLTLMSITPVVSVHAGVATAIWSMIGFSFGLALPARDKVVNGISSTVDTGKSFGIVYTGLPLGGVIGPAIIGSVIDFVNIYLGFVLNALFFAMGSFTILLFKSHLIAPVKTDECSRKAT